MREPPSRFSDWRLWVGFPILILGVAVMIGAGVMGYSSWRESYQPNSGAAGLGNGLVAGMMLLIGIGAALFAMIGAALLFVANRMAKRDPNAY
jgi:hypothetical protein